jgi:hypothetical protein
LFRSLELCGGGKAIIVSTARIGDEARSVVEKVRSIGLDVEAFHIFPDEDTSNPEDIARAVNIVRSVVGSCKEVCVDVSSGSRLEVASATTALSKDLSIPVAVTYTSFGWGPWRGLFYPLTPKPLQKAYLLTSARSLLNTSTSIFYAEARDYIDLARIGSELRKGVAEAQYNINKQLDTPCYADSESIECSCRGLEISISIGSAAPIHVKVGDYCLWRDAVEAIAKIAEGFRSRRNRLQENVAKALELLLRVAGVYQLVVDECSDSSMCDGYRDTIFIDFVRALGERVAIDTNVVYGGLHSQLWEYPEHVRSIVMPYCLLLELYTHEAQARDAYEKLRSELAGLLISEVRELRVPVDYRVSQRPCEVGMALESDPRAVLVTADVRAYNKVFKDLGRRAVLLTPKPLNEVRFTQSENSRRASYAYYAIAQLKALSGHRGVAEALQQLGVSISVRLI